MKRANIQFTPGIIGILVTLAGAGCSQAEQQEDPLLQKDVAEQTAPLAVAAPKAPVSEQVVNEVADVWSATGHDCGLDTSPRQAPNAVMAKVPKEDRAKAILYVLKNKKLEPSRIDRLLELLAATGDQAAAQDIVEFYDAAETVADQTLAEQLVNDPEPGDIRAYRNSMVASVRASAVRHAAGVRGGVALGLLRRGLEDADPSIKQAAIVGLAKRSDFADAAKLRAERGKLHPSMQLAVDSVLPAN